MHQCISPSWTSLRRATSFLTVVGVLTSARHLGSGNGPHPLASLLPLGWSSGDQLVNGELRVATNVANVLVVFRTIRTMSRNFPRMDHTLASLISWGSSLHAGDEKCPETMSTDWSIGHPYSVPKKRLEVLGIQKVVCLGEQRRPKKVSLAHSRNVPLVQVICTCFSDPALNMMRDQSRKGWHIWKSLYLPYLAQL